MLQGSLTFMLYWGEEGEGEEAAKIRVLTALDGKYSKPDFQPVIDKK